MDSATHLKNLAEGLKDGDNNAYERLYQDKCNKSIAYLVTAFGISENDAYDITASVFAKLPETIKHYDTAQDFNKWYVTVLNNAARDYIKKESHIVPVDADLLATLIIDESADIMTYNEREESAARLRDIIETLPEKQRQAATLHYLEGLTVAETAKRMNVKPETVKEHLSRARQKITDKVKAEGEKSHWLGGVAAFPILSHIAKADANSGMFQMPTNFAAAATTATTTVTTSKTAIGVVGVMGKAIGTKIGVAAISAVVAAACVGVPVYITMENRQTEQAAIIAQEQQARQSLETRLTEIEQSLAAVQTARQEVETKLTETANNLKSQQAEADEMIEEIARIQSENEELQAEIEAEKAAQAALAALESAKAQQSSSQSSGSTSGTGKIKIDREGGYAPSGDEKPDGVITGGAKAGGTGGWG